MKKQSKALVKARLEQQHKHILRRKAKKTFYKKVREGKLNDIVNRAPKFETEYFAFMWLVSRVHGLLNSDNIDSVTLGEVLEHCLVEQCGSAACSLCYRQFRMWYFGEVSHISRMYREAHLVTIVPYDQMMTDQELYLFEPKKLMNRLRTQLRRIEYEYPVIGGLEFDFHTECRLWMPHFHLLFFSGREDIEKLRHFYVGKTRKGSSSQVNRPFHVKKVRNKAICFSYTSKSYSKEIEEYDGDEDMEDFKDDPISYTAKSYSKEIEHYINAEGKRRSRPKKLKPDHLRLSLSVFHRLGFGGLMFLYKVRRQGGELVVSQK